MRMEQRLELVHESEVVPRRGWRGKFKIAAASREEHRIALPGMMLV